MKKKILAFSLAFCLLVAVVHINVTAADSPPATMPAYTGVMMAVVNIDVSASGFANPRVSIHVCNDYSVDVTMQLCYDSDEVEYTWTTSGTGMLSLSRGRYVVSGHEYYARAHVIVYDSHNNIVDNITLKSDVVSY